MEVQFSLAIGAFIGAVLLAAVQFFIGLRTSKTDEGRLGLDTLEAALQSAITRAERLDSTIALLDKQAHLALTETNRWRLLHGIMPATSLENFEGLPEEKWQELAAVVAAKAN